MPNFHPIGRRLRASIKRMPATSACAALIATLVVAAGSWNGAAFAQAYPNRPIKLIVPFPPGGPADILSRVLAKKLSEGLGQQMILENRAGAGGTIALEAAAKSPSDGYTIVLGSLSTLCIAPSIYRKLGYDPAKSFAPITMVATSPSVLVVNASLPAASLLELIELAKSKPGQLNFGSNGNGTIPHLAGVYFQSLTGVRLMHVPYKGVAPATNDLIAGQIQAAFIVSSGLEPHIRSGKLRALAVASSRRLSQLPEVPTAAEAGLPGFETYTWFGLNAPQGAPHAVIQRLNSEVATALAAREVSETLTNHGLDSGGTSPEQYAQFIGSETDKWSRIVKASGIKID